MTGFWWNSLLSHAFHRTPYNFKIALVHSLLLMPGISQSSVPISPTSSRESSQHKGSQNSFGPTHNPGDLSTLRSINSVTSVESLLPWNTTYSPFQRSRLRTPLGCHSSCHTIKANFVHYNWLHTNCVVPFLCLCVSLLSWVQLFMTPWIVAYQIPLSMGFLCPKTGKAK